MSEPIVIRSEQLSQLKDSIVGGGEAVSSTANPEADARVSSLSSDVDSSKVSISTLQDEVSTLKASVAQMKLQMAAIVETMDNNNLTIEHLNEIVPTEVDAPTAEDGDSAAPVYSVSTGTLNSSMFNADSTSFCRHYIYDNLHVIMISATRQAFTFEAGTWYEVASFSNLSGYTGHGYIAPCVMSALNPVNTAHGICRLEGSKIKIMFASKKTFSATTQPQPWSFFWFDRDAQSKLFSFEDGQLVSTAVSINSPASAVHGRLGNLHFLSITTQLVNALAADSYVNICQFTSNLSITTGSHMGLCTATASDLSKSYPMQVVAFSNNTIGVMNPLCLRSTQTDMLSGSNLTDWYYKNGRDDTIPAGSFITLDVMWIDARTVEGGASIVNGTTAMNTNDAFAKHFKLGHLNVIQAYGSLSAPSQNTSEIASFSSAVSIPWTNPQWRDIFKHSYNIREAWRCGTTQSKATTKNHSYDRVYGMIRMASLKSDKKGLTIAANFTSSVTNAPSVVNSDDIPYTESYYYDYTQYAQSGQYFSQLGRGITNYSSYNNYQILWFA